MMGGGKLDKSKLVRRRDLASVAPLIEPEFVAADRRALAADEVVLGVDLYGVAKAYPTSMLWLHHCVNDTVYIKPVLISFCILCSSGVGFDATISRSRRLTFEPYGVYQGALVMRDHQTGSLWSHVEGRCIEGKLKGEGLKQIAVVHSTWADWLRRHPETLAMSDDTPYRNRYRPLGAAKARLGSGYRRYPSDWRKGLPPQAPVLGVRTEAASWAYPLSALRPVMNGRLSGRPLVIFYDRQAGHAIAFWREVEGSELTFELAEEEIRDRESGSRWGRDGRCLGGPLEGRSLAFVPSTTVEWYAWSACYPETRVVRAVEVP